MNGAFNEMANFNGMAAIETPEFMASKMDEFGSPSVVQPLLGRLGVGDELAAPVDQAGRVPLGRHPQRHHRALARRDRGEGRPAVAVHACHRPRADDPRSRWAPRASDGQRCAAGADRGHQHAVHLQRARDPERHDLQYFEMFGNRGDLPQGLERSHQAQDAVDDRRSRTWVRSTTTCGSCTTGTSTSVRHAISPRSSRTSLRICSGCG